MSAVVTEGDHDGFYIWAVNEIETKNRGNTAFVLLEDGEVVNEYYGGNRVDRETLFPTASFSKWITALSVMSLVERKQLDLDAPVSTYLTRWQLPHSEFDHNKVTIRRLLSHTAGLTDGLGFGDYEADESIPPIEKALRNPRASSGDTVEIAVGVEPGAEFLYSGGGYLILQLVIEEVTGDSFANHVRRTIFNPVGMSRSSFDFLGDLDNVSPSFHVDGSLAPSYRYEAAAATGLASSASDLVKLVDALLGDENSPLAPSSIGAMLEPHGFVLGFGVWGLGAILYVETASGDVVYGHDGVNSPAINASVRINPESSDGFIMLVSGHPTLASNIGSEWVLWQSGYPDFLSTERGLICAIVPIVIGVVAIILLFWIVWVRRRA